MASPGNGLSRIESLFAVTLTALSILGLAWVIGTGPRVSPAESKEGPDYRDALRIARSEIEALARLSPDEIAAQIPYGERVAVIPGSLLEERQRSGAVSIVGRRVSWDDACLELERSPGKACPGLYRRIERIESPSPEGAFRVTIVVAWPALDGDLERPLRRIDLQSRIG